MHHPRHAYTIRNLRMAAFLFCLIRIMAGASVVILIVSLVQNDPRLSLVSLGVLASALLLLFVQWIYASGARCSLCRMPVLFRKGCSTHHRAKRLFGSHYLQVALSILIKGHFHCPYCNEPTILQLKSLPEQTRR